MVFSGLNIQSYQLVFYLVSFKSLNSSSHSSPRKFQFVNVSPCGTQHGLISMIITSLMLNSLFLAAELWITWAFGFIINWQQATAAPVLVLLVFEGNQLRLCIICHKGKTGLAEASRWHQKSTEPAGQRTVQLHTISPGRSLRRIEPFSAPSQGRLQKLALWVPHGKGRRRRGYHCRQKLGCLFLGSRVPGQGTEGHPGGQS